MANKFERPEVAVRQILSKIRALDLLDPEVKKRALARISKQTMQAIQKAENAQWVPAEYIIELNEALAAEIGEEGMFEWSRNTVTFSIKSSVVGPFFVAALNMFKFKPGTVLKLAPQLWKTVYRNCGEFSAVQKSPSCIHYTIEGLPLIMLRSRPQLTSIVAFIQALGEFGNADEAKAVLLEHSEADRKATIEFTWNDQTN